MLKTRQAEFLLRNGKEPQVYDAYEGKKFLINSPDSVNVGGKISLAVFVEQGEDPPNMDRTAVPIIVNPVDCVEKDFLHGNIKET